MEIVNTLGIILLVVTSHGKMEDGKPTGLWLEEFAVPHQIFVDAGYTVIVASPKGGAAPVDPRSMPENPTAHEKQALELLKQTVPLESVTGKEFNGVFFAGGHGTMFDFPTDPNVIEVVNASIRNDQPLALVCHGPAALVGATTEDGEPAVKGRKVTGFTNEEERAVDLVDEMPFLLETKFQDQGATFISVKKFTPNVVVDGMLITGQNPPSSKETAKELVSAIEKKD